MEQQLYARLEPVRRRQRSQSVLRAVARGLLAGSAVGVAAAGLRWWLPPGIVAGLAAAAILLGGAAGAWWASRRKADWHAAAAAVDAHYKLQDRTITALAFLEKAPRSALQEMQIADALGRLGQVNLAEVARSRFPKRFLGAAALMALAAALVAWPLPQTASWNPASSTEQEGAGDGLPAPGKPAAKDELPPAPTPVSARESIELNAAAAAKLRAQVDWQPAREAAVRLGTARAPGGPALRQLASQAAEDAGAGDAGSGVKPQGPEAAVPDSEPLPLRYRQTIRRYFESIRPRE